MKNLFTKKIITFIFFLNYSLFSADNSINNYKILDNHLYSWNEEFLALSKLGVLTLFTPSKDKIKSKILYTYREKPDIIKYFTLKEGYLVAAVVKKARDLIIIAFDKNYKIIFEDSYVLKNEILSADLRIDNEGSISCLFYWFKDENYVLSLWKNGTTKDLYRVELPIDQFFFQEEQKTIHMLNRYGKNYHWVIREKGNYLKVVLPFHILSPTFFSVGKYVFIVGIDIKGNLWRFNIRNNTLYQLKIDSNPNFRYVDSILPLIHKKQFKILLSSSFTNTVWSLKFYNFLTNSKIGQIETKKVITAGTISPLLVKDNLNLILQTSIEQIYIMNWEKEDQLIYDIKWDIDIKQNPINLNINWKSSSNSLLYSYILNDKKLSEPIMDFTVLSNNNISIKNPKEGQFYFHIQAKNEATKEESQIYHIPLFWLLIPPQPSVIFLNEISPSTFLPGKINFYITEQLPIEYFYEINNIPRTEPTKPLDIKNGVLSLDANLKIGWYYLHIRSKDPKSNKYSLTNHIPFSIKPYDPDQEKSDLSQIEVDTARSELDILFSELIANKKNLEKVKNIQERINKLEKKINN